MAKLFQTISLEDRLKASAYNDIGNQQKVDPKKAIQLKDTAPTIDVSGIQLKRNTAAKNTPPIPTIQPLNTKPLSKYAVPFSRTEFRSAISLRNRLDQPNLGSTAHLPQVFLSDVYTDYIKITPFGVLQHTSEVKLTTVGPVPYQGGLNPTPIEFESEMAQGMLYTNGQFISHINLSYPTADKLPSQGAKFSNGQYNSFVQTKLSINPDSIIQTDVVYLDKPLSEDGILKIQGASYANQQWLSFVNVKQAGPTPDQGNLILPTTEWYNSITLTQGGLDPVKITFEPNRTAPVLSVLKHTADRALAFFTPIIKHGSATLPTTDWQNNVIPNQGTLIDKQPQPGQTFSYVSPLLTNESEDTNVIGRFSSWDYNFVGNRDGIQYVKVGGELVLNPNSVFAQGLSDQDLASNLTSLINFPPNTSVGGLADYKTLSYGQIQTRANKSVANKNQEPLPVRMKSNTAWKYIGGKDRTKPENDFVGLTISSLTGMGSVSFSTYITSFSDSVNATWNDLTYVGRQDTLKTYKGATRAGSIAFKVPAFNKGELDGVYQRLNKLVKMAVVGQGGKGTYVTGPVCNITVGNWFKETPIVVNSVKFDVQISDYSWDLDKKLPMLVDVSLDFALLGDITGVALDSKKNNYFGIFR